LKRDGTLPANGDSEFDFDGDLWFTYGGASKVDEIKHQHVNVSYAEPKDQRYVSVSGTAQLVRDRQKIEELESAVQSLVCKRLGRTRPSTAGER